MKNFLKNKFTTRTMILITLLASINFPYTFANECNSGQSAESSSNINYNLLSKNSDLFNIKDFGAAGNGKTDDTDAVQKAIKSAGKNGGIVFFPAGTYLIKSSLIPESNIILMGVGNKSLLQYSYPPHSQTKNVIYGWHFTNQKNVTFMNLAMDGGAKNFNNDPVDADGAHHLIYFNPTKDFNVENITITNCSFSGSFDSAIQSYGRAAHPYPHPLTKTVKIDKCQFFDVGSHGVGMNEWYNSSVTNCSFSNMGKRKMIKGFGSGMAVDVSAGSQNIVVSGNVVENSAAGFKAETHESKNGDVASENVIFANNIISNCKSGPEFDVWYGIRVNGKNVTIRGNIIESYVHGILVAPKAGSAVIEGNQILGTHHKHAVGIRIDNSYGNHIINGNQIENTAAQGIVVSGNSVMVTNNRVSNSGLDGIRIGDVNGVICTQNIFMNNNGQGISAAPIAAETNNVLIANNLSFDNRSGTKRTQQRGIFVSPQNSKNVKVAENLSYNNSVAQAIVPNLSATESHSESKPTKMNNSPTSGSWQKGDVVYNSAPKVGGFVGWVCIESGSPGKWKSFGLIVP
ncbi:right-handed parallel beta-helix repeat-containing protein [Calditrichota bacterium]